MKQILKHSEPVRQELERFIRQQQATGAAPITWRQDFLDRLAPFSTGGKLLRGSLTCFSYEAFSGKKPGKGVLNAAIALELTQSALLIHDDIIDNDDLRRGQPSIHRQYQIVGRKKKLVEAPQFGINMAICGGDLSLFLAFELLADASRDPTVQRQAQQLFARQLVDTCAGQMQDVYLEARPSRPAKAEIYQVMEAKTAAYTLALPLEFGAVLAGQPAAVRRQLRQLGTAAGTIFQIRDDELGTLGDSAKTGKPVGADIREGKKTLLYYYLMQRADAKEKRKLQQIFGNPGCNARDIIYVQQLLKHYQVLEPLNKEVAKLEKQSLAAIESLTLSKISKNELQSLVTFCAHRQA